MRVRTFLVLFSVLALAAVVFAHHGSAVSYDLSQRVVTKGVITDFKYINPHPAIFWDVTGDGGKVTHWTGEIAPNVAQLQQNGWGRKRSEKALEAGTAVTVTVSPSRAGGPGAQARRDRPFHAGGARLPRARGPRGRPGSPGDGPLRRRLGAHGAPGARHHGGAGAAAADGAAAAHAHQYPRRAADGAGLTWARIPPPNRSG